MEKSKSLMVVLITVLIKLSKPLLKILGILIKTLKGAGGVKLSLGVVSFGAYSILVDWRFALSVLLLIGIHESGHVWAMRKMGMATKGFYFIPLLGGAAVPESAFPSMWAEGYIAMMGPLWGLIVTLATFGLFLLTDNQVFEVAVCWMAFINLLNLIPVYPLDGGRVIKSLILSLGGIFGFVLFLVPVSLGMTFCALQGYWLFFGFGILGILEQICEIISRKIHPEALASFNELIEGLVQVFNLPENSQFDAIQNGIKKLKDNPNLKSDFVLLHENEKNFQQLAKKWQKTRRQWEKLWKIELPYIWPIPLDYDDIKRSIFEIGGKDKEISFRGIDIDNFCNSIESISVEEEIILPDKEIEKVRALVAEFKVIVGKGEWMFLRLRQNIILQFLKNKFLSDCQKEIIAKFLIYFIVRPEIEAQFIDFYLQTRDKKEILLTARKRTYLLFAYLLLIGIFFFLMNLTGGHEAAEGAVKFFKEF